MPLTHRRAEHRQDLGLLLSEILEAPTSRGPPHSQGEGRWGFRVEGPGRQPLGFHIPTRTGAVWCTPGPTEDSYGVGRDAAPGRHLGQGMRQQERHMNCWDKIWNHITCTVRRCQPRR